LSILKKGTCKSFDVDFAPCDCKGTRHQTSQMQVIAVKWKQTTKDRVRFQCQRCKKSWVMSGIRFKGSGIILDASNPEEIKRRSKIKDYYQTTVNLGPRSNSFNAEDFPGQRTSTGRVGSTSYHQDRQDL